MKTRGLLEVILVAAVFGLVALTFTSPGSAGYATKIYKDGGGDRMVVLDGGTIQIDPGGILNHNGFILEPTAIVSAAIGGATTLQHTWVGLDSTDLILANLVDPVTCSLYAATANNGYATFYFSAALSSATLAAIALED
jgi:hypothetical protein